MLWCRIVERVNNHFFTLLLGKEEEGKEREKVNMRWWLLSPFVYLEQKKKESICICQRRADYCGSS